MNNSATDGPLTQQHHQQLAIANKRARQIRNAAQVASFNGWTIAILAALSAPFALFGVAGLLVTAGLAVVAYNEFRGRKKLRKFDPSASTLLGWNQIALLAMIVGYCLWMLYSTRAGDSDLVRELKAIPDLGAALGSRGNIEQLYNHLVDLVYGSVIALSVILQGLNAAYYFSRRKLIETYLKETPAWVLDVQRATSSSA